MKTVQLSDAWPDSWQQSYKYDLQEVYGQISNRGYSYGYQNRRRHAIEAMQKNVPAGSHVLDIAAAQGNFSLALAELGFEVTWNDLRSELAEYVGLKHERGTLHYARGNAFELNFAQPFDAVLITEIIEHVAHPDQFLQQVATLVKPGGHIVMTTPNGEYFLNPLPKFSDCPNPEQFEALQFKPNSDGHIFLLYSDEIGTLARPANLEIKEIRLFNNFLTIGHIKTGMLLKIMPRKLVDALESLTQRTKGRLSRRINSHMQVVFQKRL